MGPPSASTAAGRSRRGRRRRRDRPDHCAARRTTSTSSPRSRARLPARWSCCSNGAGDERDVGALGREAAAAAAPIPRLAPVTSTRRPAKRAVTEARLGGCPDVVDVVVVEAVVRRQDQALFHDPIGVGQSAPGRAVGDALECGLAQGVAGPDHAGVDAVVLHVLLERGALQPGLGADEDGEHVPGGVDFGRRAGEDEHVGPLREQLASGGRSCACGAARLSGSFSSWTRPNAAESSAGSKFQPISSKMKRLSYSRSPSIDEKNRWSTPLREP